MGTADDDAARLENMTADEMDQMDDWAAEDRLAKVSAGIEGRDNGMARAEEGAGPEWMARAEAAVMQVARTKAQFTTDDVWLVLDKPREPRALGPVLHRLARAGILENVGFQKTVQASRHRAPVAQWKMVRGMPLSDPNGVKI